MCTKIVSFHRTQWADKMFSVRCRKTRRDKIICNKLDCFPSFPLSLAIMSLTSCLVIFGRTHINQFRQISAFYGDVMMKRCFQRAKILHIYGIYGESKHHLFKSSHRFRRMRRGDFDLFRRYFSMHFLDMWKIYFHCTISLKFELRVCRKINARSGGFIRIADICFNLIQAQLVNLTNVQSPLDAFIATIKKAFKQ